MADRFATISEIAAELRLAPSTVWEKVRDGTIPAIQLGGPHSAWRVDKRGYRDYLAKCAARTQENSDTTTLTKTR
jgi:predicted DNA-binding transcriptional regulator AlpA